MILRYSFLTCVTCLGALILFDAVVIGSGYVLHNKGKESWGYVTVRKDAYMFWWLYYTTVNESYTSRPLVLWLQGGPGASSTGFGNFVEIGPVDLDGNNRTQSWIHEANVLFVDNPVGSGFSYVNGTEAFAKNNSQIAADLVELMKAFLLKVPEFQSVPLYIFSESYGGKMAIQFAYSLYKTVVAKKIKCSLKGVVLGDSWISPIDSVLTWGPYLYSTSLVDEVGLASIKTKADETADAVKKQDWKTATELWDKTEVAVTAATHGISFYNILKMEKDSVRRVKPKFRSPHVESLYNHHVSPFHNETLSQLMNGPVREKLRIIPKNVTWGGQSHLVFDALSDDFMIPVTSVVEAVLNRTGLSVTVYNGQLDLIVDTPGTLKWVNNLHWAGATQWQKSERVSVSTSESPVAFFKKTFKNFAFCWMLRAGHMAPQDAPAAGVKLLKSVCNIQ